MWFSRSGCSNSEDPMPDPIASYSPSSAADEDCDYNEPRSRNFFYKMIWEFGLGCFLPGCRRRRADEDPTWSEKNNGNSEHNKAWLLAESGGYGAELTDADPQSVHSSFRFSVCSQVELESMDVTYPAAVLMVNLDNGLTQSQSQKLKWGRLESLEKCIYPVAHSLIRFSYAEIVSATRNFSRGRVLGRGALSYVFRGTVGFLRTSVAIKRLDKDGKESSKAFCRELMIASSLHNPNIVPLLGFCVDTDEGFFLVYKYVSGGSLERHLHEKKGGMKGGLLHSWSVRYKVAVGIAEAVGYLHSGTERCVVHRDIKPSNILLSSKKTPKLCDFGLATWTPAPSVPFLCKSVKGTFGYLAPEYFQHGKVSNKTDVYAFGVVLLELISGRKPIEANRGPGEENLVSWAKPLLQHGEVESLLDPRLRFTQKNSTLVARLAQAASACISSEESQRPDMDEIISVLMGEPNCTNMKKSSLPGNSFNSCPQLQQSTSEIKSHLALAMLGVPDYEDYDHLYLR